MRRTSMAAESVLSSPVRNLAIILVFMAVVVVLAIFAYMAAGWSFAEASYMVVLTVYTVGYDEVRPIDTSYLHAVTITTIVFGCTGMILLTSALVQFFTELQLRQILGIDRMHNQIEMLVGHVVVCGYGRIGVMLARELADASMPLVIIERSAGKLTEAKEAGHLCMSGDATLDTTLVAAGIARARVVVAVLPDDAANVFITLSARNLNPGIEIIARGEVPTTENKLRHAGANQVVLPTHIGAARMARMILFPGSTDLSDGARLQEMTNNLGDLGLRLEMLTAGEGSTAVGLTVDQAERRAAGAFFIVQIDRGLDGTKRRPGALERIASGDRVFIVGKEGAGAARALFLSRGETRTGRKIF